MEATKLEGMDKPPTNYADIQIAINKLFTKWKEAVDEPLKSNFVYDGALDGYYDQKLKILFLGRESYDCEDDQLMDGYRNGSFTNPAYHLVDKVAYGLLNDKEWSELPERKNIPRPPKGFSFAFVNVSKFAHFPLPKRRNLSHDFEKYVEESMGENASKQNFTRKEIDLLNPDLIIAWYLSRVPGGNFMVRLTGSNSLDDSLSKDVDLWIYNSSFGREIPLLETWCFSALKKHKECFYDPIQEAVNSEVVKKLIAKKNAQDKAELR